MLRAGVLVASLVFAAGCGDEEDVERTDAGQRTAETVDPASSDAQTSSAPASDAAPREDVDSSAPAATDSATASEIDASSPATTSDAAGDARGAPEVEDAEVYAEIDAAQPVEADVELPDAQADADQSDADAEPVDAELVDAAHMDADPCVASGAACVDPNWSETCLAGHELCIDGVVKCAAQTPWLTFPGGVTPVPAYPTDGQSCAAGGTCTNGACVPPPFDPTACGGPGLHCRSNERCYLDKSPPMCCSGTGDSCNIYSCGGAFPGCQSLSVGGMGCCRQNDAH